MVTYNLIIDLQNNIMVCVNFENYYIREEEEEKFCVELKDLSLMSIDLENNIILT